jgi:hypothetical protein
VCFPSAYCFADEDPELVSGIVKLFLRELPEPLVPFKNYHKLVKLLKQENKDAEIYQEINRIPFHHHRVLSYFLNFLKFIVKHEVSSLLVIPSTPAPTHTQLKSWRVVCDFLIQMTAKRTVIS